MTIQWREVPIGEFLKLKRSLEAVAEKAFSLYADPLSEKTEGTLAELQAAWTEVLTATAIDPPEEMKDVSKLTYKQIREATQSFFAHTIGADRKPNA